jgi:hypothetical protein
MVTTKKPEITDYAIRHAIAFRMVATDLQVGHYPYYTFIKKDGVWYRRRSVDMYTDAEVKELLNRIMNDCDAKKIKYEVTARKPNLDFNWFTIVGRNGKREKVNII